MFLWHLPQLLKRGPHKPFIIGAGTCVVGTRLINDRYAKLLTVGLRLSRHRNMHSVHLIVAVSVKRGFNPKFMLDPIGLERIHHLSLAVDKFWQRRICGTRDGNKTANQKSNGSIKSIRIIQLVLPSKISVFMKCYASR